MKNRSNRRFASGLSVLLSAVMLLAACNPSSADTTNADTKQPDTDGTTSAAETDEVTTEEPDVIFPITDTLSMPEVKAVSQLQYIMANLNTILKNGYGSSSLNAAAFAKVKDKLLIFKADTIDTRTDTGVLKMYRLGEEKALVTSAIIKEDGLYISIQDICAIIGGTYTATDDGSGMVTTLHINGKTVYCVEDVGYISDGDTADASSENQVKALRTSRPVGDGKVSMHFLDPKVVADLTGLTVYETDSGLILFSCGQAFDTLKGYYIAEEAAMLFIDSAEELSEFSANEFVDIPNIFRYADTNTTVYSFPELDLHANVTAYALQGVTASVELAPAIVAGQGEDDSNYTIVRVFDRYGTVHTQFCAYPASVKGGVDVASAATADSFNILTAPFSDTSVKTLKVYDANGSYKFSITPSGDAPYAIAAGAFINASADCFAVTSMYGEGNKLVEYYSATDGSKLGETKTELSSASRTLLTTNHNTSGLEGLIIGFLEDDTKAYEINGSSAVKIETTGKYNGVFSSAFGGYIGTSDATDEYEAFSTVTEYKDGVTTAVDAGARENLFFSNWAAKRTDTYVRQGSFWHTRMEFQAPLMGKVTSGNTSAIRSDDIANFTNSLASGEGSQYKTQYNMWEPCATHRWNKTSQMGYLINYVDPDTGTYAYAALNRNSERYDYAELSSSFYNATYSPFIPALDRLHYWTLRTYLNKLAVCYKDAPEYTVAVSPVHEHEIDTGANSVGDYNPKMISGFKYYLLELYGSIENVNKVFGTEFSTDEDFDAPRGTSTKVWDKYSTKRAENPFFTQWALYNRYIISERIIESYREALLAGFPSELIKAHQIPEGDAVEGLLGEADTRLSPVDIVLACGTGYGGTRYGVWYGTKTSFFALAHTAGHNNITLGEYSSMSTDKAAAYKQLQYIFNNGGVFLHTMTWNGGVANGDLMDKSEQYAIAQLQGENKPRSASSGGVGDAHEYTNGNTSYNIVEIGSKDDSSGLLKSINADGSFEGSVYLQPFHALVTPIDLVVDGKASGTGKLSYDITGKVNAKNKEIVGINYNDTVDVRVWCKPTAAKGKLTFRVYQNGYEITPLTVSYTVKTEGEYRYCFVNQVYFADCTVVIEYEDVEATDIDVTFMYEHDARKYYSEMNPIAHKGGVSFDVLY